MGRLLEVIRSEIAAQRASGRAQRPHDGGRAGRPCRSRRSPTQTPVSACHGTCPPTPGVRASRPIPGNDMMAETKSCHLASTDRAGPTFRLAGTRGTGPLGYPRVRPGTDSGGLRSDAVSVRGTRARRREQAI